MSEKELIFIEDNSHIDGCHKGHWVMMRESDDGAMILFTGLKKETAESFKARIDNVLKRRIDLAADRFMSHFKVMTK